MEEADQLCDRIAIIDHGKIVTLDTSENLKNMVSGLMNNYDVEKRYITKAGKTIWVSLHTSLVRDSSQKPLYFVTEIENIEKRKEIENELKARLEELEKLNKLLVGRELKMIDLKNTIERLKKQSEKK